jgi:peptidoglycan/xylan/chitin deacetylase (PgdA/CDA1 family)
LKGWKKGTEEYVENAIKASEYIDTTLFRPPYGKIKKKQAKVLLKKGYEIVMWDVLSADFDTSITKEKCLSNVLDHAKKGSIVVFHDSKKAQEKIEFALPKVLEYYTTKGYIFKAIS